MRKKIHKTVRVKEHTQKDYERDHVDDVKRSYMLGVNFHKIEDMPMTDLEREVQEKIAVVPSASDPLIREEEEAVRKDMVREALRYTRLSDSERQCIKLVLKGFTPLEIARKLGLCDETVYTLLSRAREKMRRYLNSRGHRSSKLE